MSSIVCAIAGLVLSLPVGFKEVAKSSGPVSMSHGPPGAMVQEEFRSWAGQSGEVLYVFWWEPSPPRDGGPIEIAREWKQDVAGQSTTVSETKVFMGKRQKVICVSFDVKVPTAHVLIYGTGFTDDKFSKILKSVELKTPQ